MASSALTVILIGFVLVLIGTIRSRDERFNSTRSRILDNEEYDADGNRIVYKLLPRDIDSFYRGVDTPSKLYSTMFSVDVDVPKRGNLQLN